MKKIAIGTDNFRTIREGDFLYVDKSLFIREVLDGGEVLLLPRPRRFGKTLNMTMLQAFFDHKQDSRALFEGLAICGDAEAMSLQNAYPVIFLSLKSVDSSDWVSTEVLIKELITSIYRIHRPTLETLTLDEEEQAFLKAVYDRSTPLKSMTHGLKRLTEWLFRATGKKVVLLIDEYDTPIHIGHEMGYYHEIVSFLRGFLGDALKGNPYLERAVITGILRISKESIYSGLNNLAVYSIHDPEFSTCFGFTEAEVHEILCETDSSDREAGVKAWYNGYRFGEETIIYNPWSVLTYISRASKKLRPFWINTSSNLLIRELIQNEAVISLAELETLLSGGAVRKNIQEEIAFAELTSKSAWSLLLYTGYLTARNIDQDEIADLAIPNLEVQKFFRQTVASWLGGESAVRELADHLLAEDLASFASGLATAVKTVLSYHDTGAKYPERAYHVFLLGLLAHLQDRFRVASNREAGHGRADLCLIPRKPGRTGFIFELKASQTSKSLETCALNALAQILEHGYLTNLREAGASRMVAIGLAFHSKRIALAGQSFETASAEPGELQKFSAGSQELEVLPRKPTERVQEQTQKAKLVGRIQTLQQIKGKAITAETTLMRMDLEALEAFAESLSP